MTTPNILRFIKSIGPSTHRPTDYRPFTHLPIHQPPTQGHTESLLIFERLDITFTEHKHIPGKHVTILSYIIQKVY